MINVAILGFGVVGGGTARLITDNSKEIERLTGEYVNIKYILDLRDFPDSPFADRIVHDFNIILSDPEIHTVIEVMGGSHPAYEFTVAALSAGKNVVTSNKEVVANFGDEFLAIAKKTGTSYRFEAAVGGGIPVISPIISSVRHNKINEVRGILNGTTNYILTKMFSFGDSFEDSLRDAQERGYAERNPDADILGTDASRKIAILASLVTGKLVSTDRIHTEGITEIRKADVVAAERLGMKIKLLGRCIKNGDGAFIMVAPFMLPADSALYSVSGVFNAVEVSGEPIGSVMFYGPGAGAGPTASAVVADLTEIIASGRNYAVPNIVRDDGFVQDFSEFVCASYVALDGACEKCVSSVFGEVTFVESTDSVAFVTPPMSEREIAEKLKRLASERGAVVKSRIRLA